MQTKKVAISKRFSTIFMVMALLFAFLSKGQSSGNQSKLRLLPGQSVYQLDSNYAIDKNSLKFNNIAGYEQTIAFVFSPKSGILQFESVLTDTLILTYRSMPQLFTKPYYKRPTTLIEPAMRKDPFAFDPAKDLRFGTADNSLKTDGNISRGISAGNKQDLVVNSNLNLRLSGKIADDVTISGVISDDNNPIQPEGNTQQLQDFDKVFIMLSKDSSNLIVGDFEMKRPTSYFMNYYKKSRGLHVDYQKKVNSNKFYTNSDIAISRGRFARNTIQGLEGNQGPYRLNGINGETFIIIISGTEVVYLDGRRLGRGESRDYVINYNSGEVTFMPVQMITKFSRIVVEFQYSDRNYQRSVIKLGAGIQRKNSSYEVNYFSEQDNKNQAFQQSLDGYDSVRMMSAKEILAAAGDDVTNAYIPRVNTVKVFDYSKLLYRKIDTLGYKDVYVFTQNPQSDTVFYEVVYSLVGAGKGNYRQKNSSTNGRVYEWITPVAGVPQGEYAPIEILIAPKRYQMLTVGMKRRYGNTETFFEGVYTNNNINTLSQLDKSNDDGFGIMTGFKNISEIKKTKLFVTNQFKAELVNQDFKYLERYRSVEFERSWNKQLGLPNVSDTLRLPEILANYELAIEQKGIFKVNYKAGVYNRLNDISGLNNSILVYLKSKELKTSLQASGEVMNNKLPVAGGLQNNAFWNYDVEVTQPYHNNKIGIGVHDESSVFTSKTDSVDLGSYRFESARAFIESKDSSRLSYGALGEFRKDKLPYLGSLNSSTEALEIKGHGGYTAKNGIRINLNGSYRSLDYLDTLVIKGKPEKNALGRLEADIPIFKRALRFNTFYQIGTGQEQKRDYTYLQVADGLGVYIWNDYDSNKVQSLNEFEVASEYDRKRANFIRTFLPVQGFIKSRNIQFNQTINLNTPQSWYKKKGAKLFLTRFSALLVYRTDRRTTSEDPNLYLNPFIFNLQDVDLLSSNANWRGTFYINRNQPTWSADINRIRGLSKNLLVNGYETRSNDESTLNTRVNFNRNWGVLAQVIGGKKDYFSQAFAIKNYSYNFYSIEPQLQFTASGNNFGAALIGKYYSASSGEIVNNNLEAGLVLRVSKAGRGSFTGNFRVVQIAFNGDVASTLGYELMKGLLPGRNYTWNIVYQQRISSNIQMDISYDGRKSEQSSALHIGRVMARYLF